MFIKYTDKEVVEGILQNDSKVLEFLYKENFHAIAYFVYSNSGTEQEAKDICQDAIVLFYEKIESGTLELTCSIKTYLYAVCRRLWLKRLHYKSKYVGKIEEHEAYFSEVEVEEEVEKEKMFDKLEDSLSKLGEPCRALMEDYYINKLSMTEISEKYGYTNADNAKNQKYKCLMRLKKLYFKENK